MATLAQRVTGLPREVVPGLWWLGTCGEIPFQGRVIHSPWNAFLVRGETSSVLIDTGAPSGWLLIREQLSQILGAEPLDLVFPTHPELPHMGNLGHLLEWYPGLRVVGDLRNYHLYFPEHSDRLEQRSRGDRIDLGGRELVLVEAAIRDLPNTLWAYDTGSGALFVSDGFGYSHAHEANQCGLIAEELPDKPSVDHTAWITFNALSWAPHVDPARYFERLERVFEEHPTLIICPAHGSAVTDPAAMIPVMKEGLVAARVGDLFK
jgi:flavorubredoxin